MRKTYQFKLYRSKRNKHLHQQINLASSIYNHCIALHKRYYRLFGKHISLYQMHKHITKRKRLSKYAPWKHLDAQAIQNIADRIEAGYRLFFDALKSKSSRRVAPPTFRKRRKYKSITLKQTGYKLMGGNRIRIGKRIFKFHKSREIEGTIKTVTIKRDRLGDLYLYFSCLLEDVQPARAMTGKIAGFDFGLKTFLTADTEGGDIEMPQYFKASMSQIQEANRNLSRKKRGSNNRKRARLALARAHKKVANRRRDHQFKLARALATEYDYLFFEDLNLSGMKALWGRKVSDLALDKFLQALKHQAGKLGSCVHFIDRYFPSTKTCHNCGLMNEGLQLRDREWLCECGSHHDRDRNAAINIRAVGASTAGLGDVRPALLPAVAV